MARVVVGRVRGAFSGDINSSPTQSSFHPYLLAYQVLLIGRKDGRGEHVSNCLRSCECSSTMCI